MNQIHLERPYDGNPTSKLPGRVDLFVDLEQPYGLGSSGNYRFYGMKSKNWIETKYMHKLNKIIRYSEAQEEFFKEYQNYLNDY